LVYALLVAIRNREDKITDEIGSKIRGLQKSYNLLLLSFCAYIPFFFTGLVLTLDFMEKHIQNPEHMKIAMSTAAVLYLLMNSPILSWFDKKRKGITL
jgi:hypothetical protein